MEFENRLSWFILKLGFGACSGQSFCQEKVGAEKNLLEWT
jgi:hypothetical protein